MAFIEIDRHVISSPNQPKDGALQVRAVQVESVWGVCLEAEKDGVRARIFFGPDEVRAIGVALIELGHEARRAQAALPPVLVPKGAKG